MRHKNSRRDRITAVVGWLLMLPALAVPLQAAQLRAGRAAVKITPPRGMPMAGYYYVRLNTGVHDDLHAKALVLEQGGVKAAIVACDLASVPRPLVEKARALISSTTGVPGDHVMISATHTHTGPEMGARLRGVDDATMRLAQGYHQALAGKIAESVKLAEAALQPASVWAGTGQEHSVSFIRRFRMKDGSVSWNPKKQDANIERPLGEVDPDVPVVYFESGDAKPLVLYVNFANHLDTVGGLDFSADYPYTLAKVVAEAKGPEMLTIFTIGCAGNINHRDVGSPDPQKGHQEAARIGAILAGNVLRTLSRGMTPVDPQGIRVQSEIVKVPLAEIKPEDVSKAEKVVAAYNTPAAGTFYDQVHAFKVLDVARQQGKPIEAEVQVITLGNDLAWVGLPGEIFVELGQAIKLGSPYRSTIVAELANGSPGYVPDRRAYPQGAYEVISTRLAPGGGEMLAEAAIRMLVRARGDSRAVTR